MRFFYKILAIVLIWCGSPPAFSQELQTAFRVSISMPNTAIKANDRIDVDFSFTNVSPKPISLLLWNTPLEGIEADIFAVVRDQSSIGYTGKMVKRGKPHLEDYIVLHTGASVTATVNLAASYDINGLGRYSVQFQSILLDVGFEPPNILVEQYGSEKNDFIFLNSNVEFFDLIEERSSIDGIRTTDPASEIQSAGFWPINCSPRKARIAQSTGPRARRLAVASLSSLANSSQGSSRYVKWFGQYSRFRASITYRKMKATRDALQNQYITLNCACDPKHKNAYAYVYRTRPYEIFLCDAFWSTGDTGADSRMGVYIHEVSHFAVVANTNDHAYGHAQCERLARSNPQKAISNADSFEYYAENSFP